MSLADEIMAALPAAVAACPRGATVAEVARRLAASTGHVRDAMRYLDTSGRAMFMRYPDARTMYLIPLDHDIGFLRVCAHCRVAFDPMGAKRLCCTRACSVAWSWSQPDAAEKRTAGLRAAAKTPEHRERTRRHNERRWADPEQRRKLSEQNRREWADPAKKAKRAASIQAVNGSKEKRQECSRIKKAMWADPEYRERASAGMRAAKNTPEAKAKFSELLRQRWQDPEMRAKYTVANQARNAARSAKMRGAKQSPEHKAKRVEARRKSLAERKSRGEGLKQSPEHIQARVEATRRTRAARAEGQKPEE